MEKDFNRIVTDPGIAYVYGITYVNAYKYK